MDEVDSETFHTINYKVRKMMKANDFGQLEIDDSSFNKGWIVKLSSKGVKEAKKWRKIQRKKWIKEHSSIITTIAALISMLAAIIAAIVAIVAI